MPKPKIIALGVSHASRDVSKISRNFMFHPATEEPSKLVSELRRLKSQGIRKFGVEDKPARALPPELVKRYWKSIGLLTRKDNIALEHLEDRPSDVAFLVLYSAALQAYEQHSSSGEELKKIAEQLHGFVSEHHRVNYPNLPELSVLQKMSQAISRHFTTLKTEDLVRLISALEVTRSLNIYQNAVTRSLTHAAMGFNHAEDLEALILAEANHIGEAQTLVNPSNTKRRIEHYESLKPLIRTLRQIASK